MAATRGPSARSIILAFVPAVPGLGPIHATNRYRHSAFRDGITQPTEIATTRATAVEPIPRRGGQKGIDEAAFPQRMEIDYVRVFEAE